jgi:septal ring factor EnvC (AmiA/AmiB activator)
METKSRRFKMKKQAFAISAALIFLLLSAAGSFCQDQPGRFPRVQANMNQRFLDLTPEQMELLDKLRMEHQKERMVLMDKIGLLNLESRQLKRDPEANASRLKELRRQIFDLREGMFDQEIAHRKARNAILTPEQLEKIKNFESRRLWDRLAGRRSLTRRGGRTGDGLRNLRARPSRLREYLPYLQRREDPRLRFRRY